MTAFERADGCRHKAAVLRAQARLKEAQAHRLREEVLLSDNDPSLHEGRLASLNGYITAEKNARVDVLNAQAMQRHHQASMLEDKARVLEGGYGDDE